MQGSVVKWNNWGSPPTRNIVSVNGKYWMHVISNTTQFQGYSQNSPTRGGYGDIKPGDTLVASFTAYSATAGQKGCIGIHWNKSDGTIASQVWWAPSLTTTATRYILGTAVVPADCVGFNIMVGDNTTTAQELWITDIKLEKGNKATDWSPAPEDIAHVNGECLELIS